MKLPVISSNTAGARPTGESSQDVVSTQLRSRARVLGHLDRVRSAKSTLVAASLRLASEPPRPALVELHVTDVCELNCTFCTYNDREMEAFPWDGLDRVASLAPRAIVLVGGGEPTLYSHSGRRFSDVVLRLAEFLPETQMGLASNGARFPGVAAARKLSWVRISLDAATAETHDSTKRARRESFTDRIENIVAYLKAGVPAVGVGFVYHRDNVSELAQFLTVVYDSIASLDNGFMSQLNVQLRPTCGIESCACPSPKYSPTLGRLMTPDLTSEWAREQARQLEAVQSRMGADSGFEQFVRTRTNFLAQEIREPVPRVSHFAHCHLALIRMIIRADGDIFPCVMTASQRRKRVGNLLESSNEELWRGIGAYYNLEETWCQGQKECCNIDGVKNVYLQDTSVDESADAVTDPFF